VNGPARWRSRLAGALMCVAALVGLACAPAHAQAGPPAGDENPQPVPMGAVHEPGEHQILVMMRLPAPHYRPDASYGGQYIDDSGKGARRRRAEALAKQYGLAMVDDWPMPLLGLDCYVMRYPETDNAERLVALLGKDPLVEWAQPVARFDGMAQQPARTAGAIGANGMSGTSGMTGASGTTAGAAASNAAAPVPKSNPGDALYPVQPAARYWHIGDLHRYTTGREVKVAVIDSGIDAGHPDLAGQLAVNANFVDAAATPPENHGTAVAGIIAGRAGNGGIVGVAPQARLMGLRACWQLADQTTRCNSFTLGKAINYAILNGAKVINLSLSGPQDKLLDRLLDVALARGIGVVGAIDAQASGPVFPSSHRGVLAVASQPLGAVGAPSASTSSASSSIAPVALRPAAAASAANLAGLPDHPLFAPGNDIPTSAPGGRWSFVTGSSYAAAHVSGMLALLDELEPGASPAQLRGMLQPGAAPNAGNIDACATISRLLRNCGCTCTAKGLAQNAISP
jgi:subtilisin family serine protease